MGQNQKLKEEEKDEMLNEKRMMHQSASIWFASQFKIENQNDDLWSSTGREVF